VQQHWGFLFFRFNRKWLQFVCPRISAVSWRDAPQKHLPWALESRDPPPSYVVSLLLCHWIRYPWRYSICCLVRRWHHSVILWKWCQLTSPVRSCSWLVLHKSLFYALWLVWMNSDLNSSGWLKSLSYFQDGATLYFFSHNLASFLLFCSVLVLFSIYLLSWCKVLNASSFREYTFVQTIILWIASQSFGFRSESLWFLIAALLPAYWSGVAVAERSKAPGWVLRSKIVGSISLHPSQQFLTLDRNKIKKALSVRVVVVCSDHKPIWRDS